MVNGSCLTVLSHQKVFHADGPLDVQLEEATLTFRERKSRNKVVCSQARFTVNSIHSDGTVQVILSSKAWNVSCVTAWLREVCVDQSNVHPTPENLAMATCVHQLATYYDLFEQYPRYLNEQQVVEPGPD